MHPNPVYRQTTRQRALDLVRDRGFGTLMINGADGPLASHVPFVLAPDGQSADLHLVRSNPIMRALDEPVPALLAINGPDGYISPDWYGMEDQVPTWNYVAVHLRGTLQPLPPEALRDQLDRLSATFENRLLPKKPWTLDKVAEPALAKLFRMILPCRFNITDVQSTWKLGQNKPASARIGAADGLEAAGIGQDTAWLSQAMRDTND
ncbi:MAG: FMN-binding negative transcriptional regulator [Rhodobacteraceae bacterium]|nr:FMN-binding negative transcriptional regulator [Paracoccaceae bacterium]